MICGICKKNSTLSLKEKYNEYSLWECSNCLGQFWTPMKNPGAEWYEKDVRYSFRNQNPLKKPEFNHQEFLQDRPAPGGKILDIGMGTGNFLAAAAKRGYQTYGIDFDQDAIETAKNFFRLENIYPLSVDETIKKFGSSYFDALTMFEVLEHMEDPGVTIEKNKQLLKIGGYLVISVPYRGSSKLFKAHDVPPRHLTRWNEKSMENFLTRHGFSVVRLKAIPVPFAYLITKYHFWYKGIFSFGMVEKLSLAKNSKTGSNPKSSQSLWRTKLLQLAARAKDYLLFSIPAAFLYLKLRVAKQQGLTLYALAKRVS